MLPDRIHQALATVGIFRGLDAATLDSLTERLETMTVRRGGLLVRQGDPADALYVVLSGRFEVTVDGQPGIVAEIHPGTPIGEIAFLAGGTRTADVRATRDSLVLKLGRDEFDRLCAQSPAIWPSLTATLARRLAEQTAGRRVAAPGAPRAIALIAAGPAPLPPPAVEAICGALSAGRRALVVRSSDLARLTGETRVESAQVTHTLNTLEGDHEMVLYVADATLTPWSEKAMRQADHVIRVGVFAPREGTRSDFGPAHDVPLNALERFADRHFPASAQRLVLLHERRGGQKGTRHWLAGRAVSSHHHVAINDPGDLARLARFVGGTARGFVACGGGAFCCAHVGIWKALSDAGVGFDMLGGCSGGAAMTAAFALGYAPESVDASVHDIFVTNRAMRRYTWPRYSLLDHRHYDRLLRSYFAGYDIEDLWLPYFAVSTNLSTSTLHRHARGDLFEAVRASGSIPALLPPFYTREGHMLVDGCLLDNVPVQTMHEAKRGPNVVVAFEVPTHERFDVRYEELPSRGDLIRRSITPFGRAGLPKAPSLASVLMRSLMANRQDFQRRMRPGDVLLVPPLPEDMTILDWHRHGELMRKAEAWMREELARARERGEAVLLAGT